jgi:hypothetical protein
VSTPETKETSDWLEQLGMSEYAERFAENDIDFAILSDLTDQDLEKIGVASLGHRRKLLRAIANLEGVEKSGLAAAIAAALPSTSRPADTAERRQITVMFSDLVGSTALSARMDPEDLREVISAYQKCVAETVQRSGGFVAKYMGDGVLVYFGYPQAHENDAERAVRAGLELIAAVTALKTRASLQTRTCILCGEYATAKAQLRVQGRRGGHLDHLRDLSIGLGTNAYLSPILSPMTANSSFCLPTLVLTARYPGSRSLMDSSAGREDHRGQVGLDVEAATRRNIIGRFDLGSRRG